MTVPPEHIAAVEALVITGGALFMIVSVKGAALTDGQPVPFITLTVPLYVPAVTLPATGTERGLADNAVHPRLLRPADNAAAFQVML